MDVDLVATVPALAARVVAITEDLGTYPKWLGIVASALPLDGDHGDPGPAWMVDLQARIGLLRPRKRVRMVRSEVRSDGGVTFSRRELDGRGHPDWTLRCDVVPDGDHCRVKMHLHYSGAPPLPGIEWLLRQEASRAGRRLARLVAEP